MRTAYHHRLSRLEAATGLQDASAYAALEQLATCQLLRFVVALQAGVIPEGLPWALRRAVATWDTMRPADIQEFVDCYAAYVGQEPAPQVPAP